MLLRFQAGFVRSRCPGGSAPAPAHGAARGSASASRCPAPLRGWMRSASPFSLPRILPPLPRPEAAPPHPHHPRSPRAHSGAAAGSAAQPPVGAGRAGGRRDRTPTGCPGSPTETRGVLMHSPRHGFPLEARASPRDARGCSTGTQGTSCHLHRSPRDALGSPRDALLSPRTPTGGSGIPLGCSHIPTDPHGAEGGSEVQGRAGMR